MFNIDLPYKSRMNSGYRFNIGKCMTPMKHHSCKKPGSKKIYFLPIVPLEGIGAKITASSVLYFGCSKGF